MAPNIRFANRDQNFLLPPDVREWLPEGHYAWFIIDAIDNMNLKVFYRKARADGRGGAWYEPKMMATLLVYAYSLGVRSSRKIEQMCEVDVAFRVICGNLRPDHASIARFRQCHEKDFKDLFARVLELCREAGLTKAGTIALDGTKIAGNASLAANRTEEGIRQEIDQIVAEAQAVDAKEDEEFGKRRGDELPSSLQSRKSRQQRLAECLRQIEARKAAEAAKREEMLRKRKEQEAAGRPPRGRPPKEEAKVPEPKANVTDPESRIMKNGKGYVQGYNAQAVANTHQIIVAAEVTQDQNDYHQLHPMMEKAVSNLEEAGETVMPRSALADAGYATEEALSKPLPAGMEAYVSVRREGVTLGKSEPAPRGRIPQNSTATERMDRKLRTKQGRAKYKLRSSLIEPVFGQIKAGSMAFTRFSRRGVSACDSEWKLVCAVFNLRKLWKHKVSSGKGGQMIQ